MGGGLSLTENAPREILFIFPSIGGTYIQASTHMFPQGGKYYHQWLLQIKKMVWGEGLSPLTICSPNPNWVYVHMEYQVRNSRCISACYDLC